MSLQNAEPSSGSGQQAVNTFRFFYLKEIFNIGWPISVQSVMLTSMGIIDSLMVSSFGVDALASIGVGARWLLFLSLMVFGVASGGSILMTQAYGRHDSLAYSGYARLTFLVCFVLFAPVAVAIFVMPDLFSSALTGDVGIQEKAQAYIYCVAGVLLLTIPSATLDSALRSRQRSELSMRVFIVELVLNIILNYIFVFGLGPFQGFGPVGVGFASLVARSVRTVLLAIIFYRLTQGVMNWQPTVLVGAHSKQMFLNFVAVVSPLVVSSFIWSFGIFLISAMYGRMGREELAAMSIIIPVEWIGLALVCGVNQGAGLVIGKYLGAKDFMAAKRSAEESLLLAVMIGFIIGLFTILLGWLVKQFAMDESLASMLPGLEYILGLSIFLKCLVGTQMQGILKSGGDTRYCMIVDTIAQWGVCIPLAGIAVFYFHWDLISVYLLVQVEDVIKVVAARLRIKRGIWMRALV